MKYDVFELYTIEEFKIVNSAKKMYKSLVVVENSNYYWFFPPCCLLLLV